MPDSLTAVFLDRDGVINVKAPEPGYVSRWDDFEFLPGVIESIAELRAGGLLVVVVTNQRGVALGQMSRTDVEDIHRRMVESGAEVDAVYYCPHETGECDCRKPRPGMLERAAREVPGVSLGRSAAIVGDSESDMEAGRAAGLVLVKVGTAESPVDHVCGSLPEAVDWLLALAPARPGG